MRLPARAVIELSGAPLVLLGVSLLGLTLAGCTSQPAPAPQAEPAEQAATSPENSAPKTAEVKLAPAGQPTPPLDGGRLHATMPQGWKFLPRSSDYLFAAYHQDKSGVPRIVLTQEDAGDLPVTDSAETAQKLASKIGSEAGAGAAITTVNIGDNWFVRYEKAKKFRSLSARGVTLETVHSGKRYRMELLTYTEAKEEFLPALYRFAASLEFQGDAEESAAKEEAAPEGSDAGGSDSEDSDSAAGDATS